MLKEDLYKHIYELQKMSDDLQEFVKEMEFEGFDFDNINKAQLDIFCELQPSRYFVPSKSTVFMALHKLSESVANPPIEVDRSNFLKNHQDLDGLGLEARG